jgi:ATP-dependent protease Clp ATPase subunit
MKEARVAALSRSSELLELIKTRPVAVAARSLSMPRNTAWRIIRDNTMRFKLDIPPELIAILPAIRELPRISQQRLVAIYSSGSPEADLKHQFQTLLKFQ